MPDNANAADAPIIAGISASQPFSRDITVVIICTSLVKELGNRGLIGLSINLEVRVSCSVGLASLLKYPPGIFPAA